MSAADKLSNGSLPPPQTLPDIQENEPLNPKPVPEVKIAIAEIPVRREKPAPMIKKESKSEGIQVKRKKNVRTPREKFLISTCILLSSCIIILMILLICQTYLTNRRRICLTKECVKTASSLLAAMDDEADPCDDFFQYACGTWNKKHIIPEDRSSISTFEVMNDQLDLILRDLLLEPIGEDEGEGTVKAKKFFASCMNTSQIEVVGDDPLKDVIRSLGGWAVIEQQTGPPTLSIESLMGTLRGRLNQGTYIEQWVGADDTNSSLNIIQLDQMELGLPDREMYLGDSNEYLKAYLKFMTDVAELLGANRTIAKKEFQKVIDLEIKLANATLPESERHDTGSNYLKLSLEELEREVPGINWRNYFDAFLEDKITSEQLIVVYTMPFLKKLGNIMQATDKQILWNYAMWRMVMKMTPHLTQEYLSKSHQFQNVLVGVQSRRKRWSLCIESTNKRLGMAVGALFIRDNFNQESKATALEMIHTLRVAFSELLEENEWMDDETRAVAREKANAMNEKIGYPDMLTKPTELAKEFQNLTIVEDDYLGNIFRFMKYKANQNLKKLKEEVNKSKWSTAPAVLNAFYNPNFNDIAGILQPLFYSQHFPKSLNYGGIGVVIGHEMTHGFDDKGRQFDKFGNLKQWWNNRTIKAFRDRAQCIIDQYSNYKVHQVDKFLDGHITQGENIADNGGIKQAYRAYHHWVDKHGEEDQLPGLDLNHDQLFFLNYAQIWCGSMRPEETKIKMLVSVHSLGPIRVLGPLSNSYDFARAYNCPVGSKMNPKKKCYVW